MARVRGGRRDEKNQTTALLRFLSGRSANTYPRASRRASPSLLRAILSETAKRTEMARLSVGAGMIRVTREKHREGEKVPLYGRPIYINVGTGCRSIFIRLKLYCIFDLLGRAFQKIRLAKYIQSSHVSHSPSCCVSFVR